MNEAGSTWQCLLKEILDSVIVAGISEMVSCAQRRFLGSDDYVENVIDSIYEVTARIRVYALQNEDTGGGPLLKTNASINHLNSELSITPTTRTQ